MPLRKYVAIAGNIGSGKSTLVQFLAKQYQVVPFFEPNDENPYLADFYKDMHAFGFHSQLFFLSHKFRIHQDLQKLPGTLVLDRTIYEDAEIFATALYQSKKISQRDFELYWHFYQTICHSIRPPSLMIYLRCSIPTLKKRIRLRGREMEQEIPTAYLKKLQTLYDAWIAKFSSCDVITIETDKMDYLTDLVHRIDVMKKIEKFL